MLKIYVHIVSSNITVMNSSHRNAVELEKRFGILNTRKDSHLRPVNCVGNFLSPKSLSIMQFLLYYSQVNF